MRSPFRTAGALALALLGATALAAQQSAPDSGAPIVVEGRTKPTVRAYVARVARPELGYQVARWNMPICVQYDGLADSVAQALRARLATVAAGVSLKLVGPGCKLDVLVKLTDQADALTRALLRAPYRRNGNVGRSNAVRTHQVAALEQPHTVRWLTATLTSGPDGRPIIAGTNAIWSPTLLHAPTREDVATKLILIDTQRLQGVTLAQLSDYLVFITLASPDIAADYADTDSIMALFAGGDRPPPRGLTQQDCRFLGALYSLPAELTPDRQAAALRASILSGKAPSACKAD